MSKWKRLQRKHRRAEDINAPVSWDCVDCGMNTAPGMASRAEIVTWFNDPKRKRTDTLPNYIDDKTEVYSVQDWVWAAAGMTDFGGCLCIGCLEKRLGRRLNPDDFPDDGSFNRMPGSPRLLDRRGAQSKLGDYPDP